jgi:Smr domain
LSWPSRLSTNVQRPTSNVQPLQPVPRRSNPSGTPIFALDEARYGRDRILDLHTWRPTGADAARRADAWLRERQAAKAGEVLIITGRGRGSPDGIPVVRDAIARLLPTLRRAGVIVGAREHGAGAFAVQLAPLQALVDAPRRRRPAAHTPRTDPQGLDGLDDETRALLRRLAVAALGALGMRSPTDQFVGEEMVRQFTILAATVTTTDRPESALRGVLKRALDEYES